MGLLLRTYFEEQISPIQHTVMSNMDSFYRAAHDLRSPLSAVNLTIHHLKKSSPDLDHLGLLDEAVKRINGIAQEILNAHKKQLQTGNLDSFNLGDAIQEFSREANLQLGKVITIDISQLPRPSELQVFGIHTNFIRILWNLLQNAQDAQASCWSIKLETTPSQIILRLQDNGHGIPVGTLNKIGIEGFTTKENGNGLGLYSSIQTLRSWQGNLMVKSQLQVGTTIKILLTKVLS